MTRKQKFVRCCVCGEVGRRKRNTIVKRFSYPQKTVVVPNITQFDRIADAWDYAAKVCLRMSQRALVDPPSNTQLDEQVAEAFYQHFGTVIAHSHADIIRFESVHSRRIKERLANIRSNPDAAVSRMSLSLLYGAIVCTVMSELFYDPHSVFEKVKGQREAAYGIYTHYSLLLVDERSKTTWIGWFNIILDSIRFGPNAAAKLHTKEVMSGSLGRKQVKDKMSEVTHKLEQATIHNPAFDAVFRKFGRLTRSDPHLSSTMLSLFDKCQFEVYDQKRKFEYAWVIHDKSPGLHTNNDDDYFRESKRNSNYLRNAKSRWCQISPYQSLPIVAGNT